MADITPTAAEVVDDSSKTENRVSGAAITAGQFVYLDTANSNVAKLAQCDGTALEATVRGVAVNTADASGMPITIQTSGDVTLGATAAMTLSKTYCISNAAGKVAPDADIATSTWYKSVVGVATSTSVLRLAINNSGAQVA